MEISMNRMNPSTNNLYQNTTISSQEECKIKQIIKDTTSENTNCAVSAHGDTLTISDTGKAASLHRNTQNKEESENEISTNDLSTYTETELKQLYFNGTITKIEYD